MRPKNARIVVPPAPRKLKPGTKAAREAGCRCWASYRSNVTGGDWRLDPACPLGHTEADLEPLRIPGGMTGHDPMPGEAP